MPLRCQEMMERKVPPPSCSLEPSRACRRKHAPDRSHAGVARRDCTPGFHTGAGPKPSEENTKHMRGRKGTCCIACARVLGAGPGGCCDRPGAGTAWHGIGFGKRAQSSVRIRPVHSIRTSAFPPCQVGGSATICSRLRYTNARGARSCYTPLLTPP